MNCRECSSHIQDYLDKELDEKRSDEVGWHLHQCEKCRSALQQMQLLKEFVNKKFSPPPAPFDLANRICRAIRTKNIREGKGAINSASKGRGRVWMALLAFVFVLPGISIWMFRSSLESETAVKNAAKSLTSKLVDDHIRLLAEKDPWHFKNEHKRSIEKWFEGKLTINVKAPSFRNRELKLEGGRICHIADLRTALFFYRMQRQRLSLFVINAGVFDRKEEETTENVSVLLRKNYKGYTVFYWQKNGLMYAMITDEKVEQLAKMIAKT